MPAIRRNIFNDTASRGNFIKGVKLLKNEVVGSSRLSTYDQFVVWHHDAMWTHTPQSQGEAPHRRRNAAHRGPVFLPWHRFMLLVLEQHLQRVLNDPSFALPYWNWHQDGDKEPDEQIRSEIWSEHYMGDSGGPVTTGPFAYETNDPNSWRVRVAPRMEEAEKLDGTLDRGLNRSLASDPRFFTLPTTQQVKFALTLSVYDEESWFTSRSSSPSTIDTSFRNVIEGSHVSSEPQLHNLVHVRVGGDMGPSTSPNDPVFFLNHVNVDRIWAAWQRSYPDSPYLPGDDDSPELAGHRLHDKLHSRYPDPPTPADMLDVSKIYEYDTLDILFPTLPELGSLSMNIRHSSGDSYNAADC